MEVEVMIKLQQKMIRIRNRKIKILRRPRSRKNKNLQRLNKRKIKNQKRMKFLKNHKLLQKGKNRN